MATLPASAALRQPPEPLRPVARHYVSADSVPRGFAVARSPWLTPSLLTLFAALSGVLVVYGGTLHRVYVGGLAAATSVIPTLPLLQGSLALRPFFLALVTLLPLFSAGSVGQRLKAAFFAAGLYGIFSFLIDTTLIRLAAFGGPGPFTLVGNVANGFLGVLVIAFTVLGWYHLPPEVAVRRHRRQSFWHFFKLLFSIAVAALVTVAVLRFAAGYIGYVKGVALLGGLGPGVAFFFPLLALTLFLVGTLERALRASRWKVTEWRGVGEDRLLSVAFLVPAYNEAHNIAACIRALDRAASRYPALCRLYLVDNASTDQTFAVAQRTLFSCKTLLPPLSQVLTCPTPGKANALNFGLAHVEEDLVIRVDADTEVEPRLLQKLVPHFWDAQVGGVAGMTLPKRAWHWLSLMRRIEVYYNVGFLRVAQGAVDGIMVLPGIMSAYRRELVQELGGFGAGFNGEDTDVAIRLGRMGYRLEVDPNLFVYTEVPETLAHLREQRLRWTRSYFHVIARNAQAVRGLQGTRGWWVLPTGVLGICRRLVVLPLLLYALATLVLDPGAPFLRHGVAIVTVLAGPHVILLTLTLVWYRQPLLLLLIPYYLLFRVFRTYIALESFLTLPLRQPEPVAAPIPEPIVPVASRRAEPMATAGGAPAASLLENPASLPVAANGAGRVAQRQFGRLTTEEPG